MTAIKLDEREEMTFRVRQGDFDPTERRNKMTPETELACYSEELSNYRERKAEMRDSRS